MPCLDFWAVGTTTGLAKIVASEGAWASKILSLSAWLRTAFISGNCAIWAAVKAIWAADSWSSGFWTELVVVMVLLIVPARMVWLALRLVKIKVPIPISKTKLPTTKPQRVRRFLDFLLSFLSFGFFGNKGREFTFGTRLTMSLIEIDGLRILRMGILKTSKINERLYLPLKHYYTKLRC